MFKDDGLRAYGLQGDGPFYLSQGGGVTTDLRRARQFNVDTHAHARAKDMKNYVFVHGGLAMRLSEVQKRKVS